MAAAMTMQLVARTKGITMPVARSKIASPRKERFHFLASREKGNRKVMLMPTAVAAAAIIISRCMPRICPCQKVRASSREMASSNERYCEEGSVMSDSLGMKPRTMVPQSTSWRMAITTPMKDSTIMATMTLRIISYILMPLPLPP